ncbi:Uncharacterised protein [uncultured archaeon]|nr:Uncharacterised protein [uncultured archaeon]
MARVHAPGISASAQIQSSVFNRGAGKRQVYMNWRNPMSGKFYYGKKTGRSSGFRYKKAYGGRMWSQHHLPPVSFEASKVIGRSAREKPFNASEVIIAAQKKPGSTR